MYDFKDNPFAPPSDQSLALDGSNPAEDQPATRISRLGAAIVDGFAIAAIILPVQYLSGYLSRVAQQQVSVLEILLMSLLGLVVFLVLNGYLLINRGQTLGKIAAGVQIVDFETGRLLPFLRVYVFRSLWMMSLTIASVLIPGNTDDLIFNLIIIVNVLMIFGSARRCLHDHFAGSRVVQYREGREHLTAAMVP